MIVVLLLTLSAWRRTVHGTRNWSPNTGRSSSYPIVFWSITESPIESVALKLRNPTGYLESIYAVPAALSASYPTALVWLKSAAWLAHTLPAAAQEPNSGLPFIWFLLFSPLTHSLARSLAYTWHTTKNLPRRQFLTPRSSIQVEEHNVNGKWCRTRSVLYADDGSIHVLPRWTSKVYLGLATCTSNARDLTMSCTSTLGMTVRWFQFIHSLLSPRNFAHLTHVTTSLLLTDSALTGCKPTCGWRNAGG